MKETKFSNKEALRFGWETMKKNFAFFLGLLLVSTLLYFAPWSLAGIVVETAPLLGVLIYLIDIFITFVVSLGLIKISILFCDTGKAEFADLFRQYPLVLKYLGGSILYGLIVFAGTILLIVPGIIWGIKYWFYDYLIVDQGAGPVEALKKSSAITKGAKGKLFVFFIVMGLVNLLGLLCLGIGLFATVPTTMIAIAFVYRKLASRTETADQTDTVFSPATDSGPAGA